MFGDVSQELIVIAGVSWLIAMGIVIRVLSLKWALPIVTLKIGLVVVYFAWFYDGTWTIGDDKEYQIQALELLGMGFNPFSMLFTHDGFDTLWNVASRSRHLLYTWWVYTSEYVFSPDYYTPVFMNVVLTFVAGVILYRLCISEGFSRKYAKGLLIVFLLHWDILVWSSLISIKDTLVMTLTIAVFGLAYPLIKNLSIDMKNFIRLIGLAIIIYTLTFLRFYLPVLLLGSIALYIVIGRGGVRHYYTFIAIVSVLIIIVIFTPLIQFHIDKEIVFSGKEFLFGIIRFPLTPRPWSLEPAYTFLFFPAILHWLMFIPAIIGGYILWHRSDLCRLLIIYIFVVIVFYATVVVLQNTRMRYQLTYILVWMQYHSIVVIWQYFRKKYSPVFAHSTSA